MKLSKIFLASSFTTLLFFAGCKKDNNASRYAAINPSLPDVAIGTEKSGNIYTYPLGATIPMTVTGYIKPAVGITNADVIITRINKVTKLPEPVDTIHVTQPSYTVGTVSFSANYPSLLTLNVNLNVYSAKIITADDYTYNVSVKTSTNVTSQSASCGPFTLK